MIHKIEGFVASRISRSAFVCAAQLNPDKTVIRDQKQSSCEVQLQRTIPTPLDCEHSVPSN